MLFRVIGPVLFGGLLALGAMTSASASHSAFHPCDPWGSWGETSRECKFGMFCFGAGQKKTLIHYQRTRQCRKGVVVQNKTKSLCGC